MKSTFTIISLLFLTCSLVLAQQDYKVHTRGMLHQSVFNTGDLGRPLDNGSTKGILGMPSFEWPSSNGHNVTLLGTDYVGFYNSFGGGFWIVADTAQLQPGERTSPRMYVQCGACTDNSGHNQTGGAIITGPVQYITNFPLLPNGDVNPAYNPDEAEENIISTWDTPLGITVTRTSRAWSHPDYDDFIIYDYQLTNTGRHSWNGKTDTLRALMVAYAYSLGPSLIADMLLNSGKWLEGSMRDDKAGALGFVYGRFDWHRYMIYDHTIDGVPFSIGSDSILTAPGAIGILPLYYDYDHLATKYNVNVALASGAQASDSLQLWDSNNKLKQPYNILYDNGNLSVDKFKKCLDIEQQRYSTPFRNSSDSTTFGTYWIGRGKPNWSNTLRNPTGKVYGFGPYTLNPGETMHFVVAEVAGFGPRTPEYVDHPIPDTSADKRTYYDLGGNTGSNDPATPPPGIEPIPSWWDTVYYDYSSDIFPGRAIGSTYMQTHRLPDYVNSTNVISVRDVADRAIQLYTGQPLVKYDSLQFEPLNSPPAGVYRIPVTCPAPVITVASINPNNLPVASNQISWGSQVESIARSTLGFSRLVAPLSYYKVLRATSPIGPWTMLDSIGKLDSRYYAGTKYVYYDQTCQLLSKYFYAVQSIDSLDGKSALTNLTYHDTQLPAVTRLGKVYAAPNPFILSSHYQDNKNDRIGFFGLPQNATIRVFSYSGQLIATIEHRNAGYSTEWFQISRNNQWVASGVYYFVVDDIDKGDRSWGKFVIIH